MDRSERRWRNQQIKGELIRRAEESLAWRIQHNYSSLVRFLKLEFDPEAERQELRRLHFRNEGRSYNRRCTCERCYDNRHYGFIRDLERMAQEEEYFFEHGFYSVERESPAPRGQG